jgi:hypothetical protein
MLSCYKDFLHRQKCGIQAEKHTANNANPPPSLMPIYFGSGDAGMTLPQSHVYLHLKTNTTELCCLVTRTLLAATARTTHEGNTKLASYSMAVATTSIAAVVRCVHKASAFSSADLVTDFLASDLATGSLPRTLLHISTDLPDHLLIEWCASWAVREHGWLRRAVCSTRIAIWFAGNVGDRLTASTLHPLVQSGAMLLGSACLVTRRQSRAGSTCRTLCILTALGFLTLRVALAVLLSEVAFITSPWLGDALVVLAMNRIALWISICWEVAVLGRVTLRCRRTDCSTCRPQDCGMWSCNLRLHPVRSSDAKLLEWQPSAPCDKLCNEVMSMHSTASQYAAPCCIQNLGRIVEQTQILGAGSVTAHLLCTQHTQRPSPEYM